MWLSVALAFPSQTARAASTPTFSSDIAPILQKNCLACHSSAAKMGGFVMESYDLLMKGGKDGPTIVPGRSEQSRLVQMLEGKVQPRMPFGADPLPATDIAALKAWIEAGAKGPAAGEAARTLAPVTIPDIKPKAPAVSPVVSLKFSPDGRILAVGGYKEVRLMDASTGKVIRTLEGHADYVRSIVFSPDGKQLLAGGGPPQQWGEIKVWDVATGALLRTMRGHADCIYSVAVSPDGKLVASGSYDKSIHIWDAQTGKDLKTLLDHIDAVFAVAFSPDGKLLASGSQDRSVKIWNVASGERLYTLNDALDGITGIAFSPSGEYLAGAGYDDSIHVWKISEKEGSLVQSLIADEDSILQIVWSPEGKTLITSSSDGSIRFRDAATLDPVGVLPGQPDWVDALAISPDGKWLAAGRYDGTLSLYDARSYKPRLGPLMAEGSRQIGR
ncbi:MAG: c-type cytochrome domain-containing protein [Terriglobales bacterium]